MFSYRKVIISGLLTACHVLFPLYHSKILAYTTALLSIFLLIKEQHIMCTVKYAVTIETITFLNKNVNVNLKTGNIVRTAVIKEKNIKNQQLTSNQIRYYSGIICSKT